MKELLLNKGFKLNNYSEGNYYEWETNDTNVISNILTNGLYWIRRKINIAMQRRFY